METKDLTSINSLFSGATGGSGALEPPKNPVTVLEMSDTFAVAWLMVFVADSRALPSSCNNTFSTGSIPGTLSISSRLNWASCLIYQNTLTFDLD